MENFDKKSVPVIRHLDDVDDLRKFGRDGELLPNQEDSAREYANEILNMVYQENKKAVILICSPLKRGIGTGKLISQEIKKLDQSIKVVVSKNESLTNLYEGVLNLPEDYEVGTEFEGLKIGKKIFGKEVFSDNPNLLYRFGDPVKTPEGFKYPELDGYFIEYGESFRDFLMRLFSIIVETAENIDRLNQKTKFVIITHSQQYQMFYDLQTIAHDIIKGTIEIMPGDLPKLAWQRYSERINKNQPVYDVRCIDIDCLHDKKVIESIKNEIDYLKKLI